MSRAVTADQILFDECIEAFRREDGKVPFYLAGKSKSFLLLTFRLPKELKFNNFSISPTYEVILPGAYNSFISTVENPEWVGTHNPHLFGIALSAIFSLFTDFPIKSTRYTSYIGKEIDKRTLEELAVQNPILTAGTGGHKINLSDESLSRLYDNISNFIENLHEVDYKTYRICMQAVRLIHLANINKREDFGLAYLLKISAIEAIAQKAISRDMVKEKNPNESNWKRRAKSDKEFKELLTLYKSLRGQNNYLAKRYYRFIMDYCPPEIWEKEMRHPILELYEFTRNDASFITNKSIFEKYPSDLLPEELEKIIKDSYRHRSSFIHEGKQPPHESSFSIFRFFIQQVDFSKELYATVLLLNYELISFIAKYSLVKWLDEKVNIKT